MYRAASRIPRRAALAASAAATGLVLHEQPREKLSIYSSPDPQIVLVESPSPLSLQIAVYRRHLQSTYADTHAYVQGWVSKWIEVEQAVENRVKSIISPNEPLTPGLLYVGVSTLTGSIIARNRFILTRLALPPLFLILSAHHFLPETTTNLSNYLGSVEEHYFPTLAQKHEIAKAHSKMGWEMLKEKTQELREKAGNGVVGAVDKVQGATGLKIKETLGLQREEFKKAVEEVRRSVVEKAEEALIAKSQTEAPVEPAAAAPEPAVPEKKEEKEPKRLV
ncbi:hypothetical protein CC1G_02094 [Coprinopsis cinerea okayama7|uniref:MICOS complex subunit n=1 Tax=Coprinopsis cinerea (strain Okayama-7 / 130 / ATCC MYA-4618 / FGSC 9003) TaxID=240176 RepID=A8NK59_COPC7|nr:hypothetical protein CC1G_02094 [Coprinopsis cinerea okayama7\|eukprot:XP_001834358.1 hypothetical protein CC1G_02094 [Coprinopsis cinerea okayama7\